MKFAFGQLLILYSFAINSANLFKCTAQDKIGDFYKNSIHLPALNVYFCNSPIKITHEKYRITGIGIAAGAERLQQ